MSFTPLGDRGTWRTQTLVSAGIAVAAVMAWLTTGFINLCTQSPSGISFWVPIMTGVLYSAVLVVVLVLCISSTAHRYSLGR